MIGRRASRLAPPRYIACGGSPPRCAALPPPPPPRCIARGGSPPRCLAWQVAHAESFAGASPCAPHSRAGRGVRSPTRGTAAGPNHYTRALPGRRDACPPGLPAHATAPAKTPKSLCSYTSRPVPSLFVFLCVKNSCPGGAPLAPPTTAVGTPDYGCRTSRPRPAAPPWRLVICR